MKKLSDTKLLKGQTETISMMEFRQRPGEVLQQVQMGKTFNISKNGKVVAVLAPPEPSALELAAELRRVERFIKSR